MAGRMGYEKVTVKNLMVVAVSDSEIFVKGLIPGHINSFVVMKKVGESKKFAPIHKETEEAKVEVKTEAKQEGVQNEVQDLLEKSETCSAVRSVSQTIRTTRRGSGHGRRSGGVLLLSQNRTLLQSPSVGIRTILLFGRRYSRSDSRGKAVVRRCIGLGPGRGD